MRLLKSYAFVLVNAFNTNLVGVTFCHLTQDCMGILMPGFSLSHSNTPRLPVIMESLCGRLAFVNGSDKERGAPENAKTSGVYHRVMGAGNTVDYCRNLSKAAIFVKSAASPEWGEMPSPPRVMSCILLLLRALEYDIHDLFNTSSKKGDNNGLPQTWEFRTKGIRYWSGR